MSKKITHEQAKVNFAYVLYGNIHNERELARQRLFNYFEQQEKQEKLLELYKELIIELDLEFEEFERFGDKVKNPELDKLRIKDANFVFEGKAPKLFKQIKELENGSEIQTKQHL